MNVFPHEFLLNLGLSLKRVKPIRAVIFGSALRKGLNVHDLDLLVLSDIFENYYWQERFGILSLPSGPLYDLRLFTPKEFEIIFPINNFFRMSIEKNNFSLEEYL